MLVKAIPLIIALVAIPLVQADETRTFCGKTLDGWIGALKSDSPGEVRQAVVVLGYFGPEAKAAVPRLVELLRENQFTDDLIDALGRIGPEAGETAAPLILKRFPPKLCFACQQGAFGISSYGYPPYALRRMGRTAVPALIAILNDPKSEIRPCAVDVLGQIGPDAKDSVRSLISIVEGENNDPSSECLQGRAAHALGRIGPEARAAVPTFERLLDRELTRRGFGFGDHREPAVVLAKIGMPPIRKLLNLSHTDACQELSLLGPMAKGAIPDLRKDLSDDCPIVRTNAASALAQIDPTIEEAIPPLIEALNSDVEDSWGLPDVLARSGPIAKDAIPSLVRKFERDPEPWEVLVLLTMIDSEGTACVPSLIAGLKHEDSWAVNNAAECLSLIGPKAKAALPALRMAIFRPYSDRSNIDPPVSALKALVRIDPESHETMAILCQALKHRTEMGGIEEILGRKDEPSFDYSVAEAAARILGYHGPKAKSAVPALIEALHGWRNSNSHPYKVGREFVLALGLIGVNAEDAIPLLRLLAGDSLKAARPDRLGQPPSFGVVDKASAISLLSLDPESRRAAENGDPPSSDSETTAAFLVALGRPSLEAELILRREMEDIDEQIHESMIRTDIPSQLEWRYERLSRFGLASRSAIPKLKEWQKHPNPWIRLWAGEAKSRIP